jgi:hypothetical protein
MYRSSDVLAHFKGLCAFFEMVVQHASHQKEETIYCPYNVCKNDAMFKDHEVICEHLAQSGFMDNYFIWTMHDKTQPRTKRIIDEREQKRTWVFQMTCVVICHTPGSKKHRTEASIRVARMFDHTHSNNMINR